jgi:hypothetical protein
MDFLSSDRALEDFLRRVVHNPTRAILEHVTVSGDAESEKYDAETDRLLNLLRETS